MTKKLIQQILSVLITLIGAYMFVGFDFMTPPSISGIAFFLTGLALWVQHCPLCAKICKK